MIDSQEFISEQRNILEKNAVIGKLELEKRLSAISKLQLDVKHITESEKPVLKYQTSTSCVGLQANRTDPQIDNKLISVTTKSPRPAGKDNHLLYPPLDLSSLQLTDIKAKSNLNNIIANEHNSYRLHNSSNFSQIKSNDEDSISFNELNNPNSFAAFLPPQSISTNNNYLNHMNQNVYSYKNLNVGSNDVMKKPLTKDSILNVDDSKMISRKWNSEKPNDNFSKPTARSWTNATMVQRINTSNETKPCEVATNTLKSYMNSYANSSLAPIKPHNFNEDLSINVSRRVKPPNFNNPNQSQLKIGTMGETKSCPNVSSLSINDNQEYLALLNHNQVKSESETNITTMTITNNKTFRSKPLVTSNGGTFTSKKIKTLTEDLSGKQKPRSLHTKGRHGFGHNFSYINQCLTGKTGMQSQATIPLKHVSSIPNQSSRLVLDDSFTVLNSTSTTKLSKNGDNSGVTRRMPKVLSLKHFDVYANGANIKACPLPPQHNSKPKSGVSKKFRSISSARSRGHKSNSTDSQLVPDVVKQTSTKVHRGLLFSARSRRSINSDTDSKVCSENVILRKNSNDSGHYTLSSKSGRSCGDGKVSSNQKLKPEQIYNKTFENFQQWDERQGREETLEFDYEEENGSEVCVEEDDVSVGLEEVEAIDQEGNDSGSNFKYMGATEFELGGDDLDYADNAAVNFLDEDIDDGGSEIAGSEYSVSTTASQCTAHSGENDKSSEFSKPALIISVFSNCPPVINFATKHENINSLSHDIRKLLKWKISSITPIVVRNTVMKSGFKPSKKNHDWLGYFGKHMKASGFRGVREYQKINHFPGSFQLGRKDRLWRNLSRMQTRFGKKEFGFVPQTFVLPWDKKLLKNAWDEGNSKQKFIIKPPASARGIGIKVIHKWSQVPMKKPILVQKYLSRPYLINGSKFDLRLYVHVTSFDPLRVYLFHDGLVRFATCKYSTSTKHLSNRYMHLTNYSINKKSGEFQQNDDASICQGHKWSLKALWKYFVDNGIKTDKIWEQIKDILIKTIISIEQFTNSLIKSNCRRRYCCHELFGFDIMLDDRLRPWVLEVNISPSLHSNSPLDVEIKGPMVKDMFNLCGYLIPDKKVILANATNTNANGNVISATATFSQDKRKQGSEVSPDSRAKHTYYAQHHKQMDEQELASFMLDVLTVNDIRMLVESENENMRRGEFDRIFPCINKKYTHFFEQPRYYNALLHVWERRYTHQKQRGIALLESFCRKGLHLPHFSADPASIPAEHVWSASCINQNRIFISPRMDVRLLPAVIKPSSNLNGLSLSHSPTATGKSIPRKREDRIGSCSSACGNTSSSSKNIAYISSVKVRAFSSSHVEK